MTIPSGNKLRGIARIDRVAAMFDVWSDGLLPFAMFRIKVIERGENNFLGVLNVSVQNPKTGDPEYTSGLGKTVDEALLDALESFWREVRQNLDENQLTAANFIWSESTDF